MENAYSSKIVAAVDIGNSQLTAGIFESGVLKEHFYVACKSNDKCIERIMESTPQSIVISSVVPERSASLSELFKSKGISARILKSGQSSLIKGCYATMGSDRVANLVAARALFGADRAHIVIDCGTATTLSAVDQAGQFAGGFITLGYGATLDMLSKRTAQLPLPEVQEAKEDSLGFNTDSSILNGTLLGQVAIIDLWILKAKKSLAMDPNNSTIEVTATGGWCQEIASRSRLVDRLDPLLTIKGVYLTGALEADRAGPS